MARFWEGTLTYKENGTGETKVKNVKLVSNDDPGDPITNNTKFFDIKDAHNGFDECCTTPIRLVEVTEETEEDVKRVDYNKRKFGPVTVKSYTIDEVQGGGFQLTLQSVEEYMTQDVPLGELINATKSAMYLRYGGKIDIIDSDAFIDGKTYESINGLENEIAEFNNGYVDLSNGGVEIDEVYQGTLTGYDIASEKFNSTAAGTVISIIGLSAEG